MGIRNFPRGLDFGLFGPWEVPSEKSKSEKPNPEFEKWKVEKWKLVAGGNGNPKSEVKSRGGGKRESEKWNDFTLFTFLENGSPRQSTLYTRILN